MVAPRVLIGGGDEGKLRDEESAKMEDSPSSKRNRLEGRFPLTRWELAVAMAVFFVFAIGLFFIFMKMPAAEYGKIKVPRSIADLRLLKYCFSLFSFYVFFRLNYYGELLITVNAMFIS